MGQGGYVWVSFYLTILGRLVIHVSRGMTKAAVLPLPGKEEGGGGVRGEGRERWRGEGMRAMKQ